MGESLSESSENPEVGDKPKSSKSGPRSGNVFVRLQAILVEQLDVDEDAIVPSASFTDDLNADSLDAVEMFMSVEEEFGLEIPDEDAEKIVTVQDVIDYLRDHGVSD